MPEEKPQKITPREKAPKNRQSSSLDVVGLIVLLVVLFKAVLLVPSGHKASIHLPWGLDYTVGAGVKLIVPFVSTVEVYEEKAFF